MLLVDSSVVLTELSAHPLWHAYGDGTAVWDFDRLAI